MKILVPTKRVPDTDQRITLREDRRGINDDQLPFVINPFDAIALEEAIRLREAGCDAEILIVG
ncbi:MAG: electron transfer flavoprotein subunit beta/FixA family protein, partial [Planctomycetales bacterium]